MSETKTPTPFVCDNCDYRPTIEEVLHHNGDCPKCHDTISVFTVDAAHQLTAALDARKTAEKRAEDAEKACASVKAWRERTPSPHCCEDCPCGYWLDEIDELLKDASSNYVPKSKLDEAIKALEGCVALLDRYQQRGVLGDDKAIVEAIAAAEKVTKQ